MVTQHYDHQFRAVGLRSTQFNLLAAVKDAGPVSMTRLADILGMDRTTLNRDLKPLLRDGLVRVKKGRDRRVRLVSLTKVGKTKVRAGFPIWRRLQDQLHEGMGKKHWKSLRKELSRTSHVVGTERDR